LKQKKIKKYVCPNCEKLGHKTEREPTKRKLKQMLQNSIEIPKQNGNLLNGTHNSTSNTTQTVTTQNNINSIPVSSKPIQNSEKATKKRKITNSTSIGFDSNSNRNSGISAVVVCNCQSKEINGSMVQCGICNYWSHIECIKLSTQIVYTEDNLKIPEEIKSLLLLMEHYHPL